MVSKLKYGVKFLYLTALANYYRAKSLPLVTTRYGERILLIEFKDCEVEKNLIAVEHVGSVHFWYRPYGADLDEEFMDTYICDISLYNKTWFLLRPTDDA